MEHQRVQLTHKLENKHGNTSSRKYLLGRESMSYLHDKSVNTQLIISVALEVD